MIDLNRFFTADEIRGKYQVPSSLFAKIINAIPFHYEDEEGVRYYIESRVDRFFEEYGKRMETPSAPVHGMPAQYPDNTDPDGPVPPDRLRLSGKVYQDITKKGWLLLQCLWQREWVVIDDVMEHVYGHDYEQCDETLYSLCKRTSSLLITQGCPAEIKRKAGYIMLEVYSGRPGESPRL